MPAAGENFDDFYSKDGLETIKANTEGSFYGSLKVLFNDFKI